jgi:hypothetical protein
MLAVSLMIEHIGWFRACSAAPAALWRQELMASKVKIPQDEKIAIEAKR